MIEGRQEWLHSMKPFTDTLKTSKADQCKKPKQGQLEEKMLGILMMLDFTGWL